MPLEHTYSNYIERSAKSYYYLYETRFLAIEALNSAIAEEYVKPFPQKVKIENFLAMIDYLRDLHNPVY